MKSLARPGGNVTGLTDIAPETVGKRLQLLRTATPGLARVAVLWNPANVTAAPQVKETEKVARSVGIVIRSLERADVNQLEATVAGAAKDQAQAVMTYGADVVEMHRQPSWTGS